jgi:Flp pilus assembly protein TadD
MVKTSLKQKILLVLGSVIFTLALLEAVLRFGGMMVEWKQASFNKASFAGDEVRILCIGESTTQVGNESAYPQQLEVILNERFQGKKRFKVLNRGETAQTSKVLLSHLDGNLSRFRPHIVVGMIGINDVADTPGFILKDSLDAFLNHFRVYHLALLLKQHVAKTLEDRRLKGVLPAASVLPGGAVASGGIPVSRSNVNDSELPRIMKELASTQALLMAEQARLSDAGLGQDEKSAVAARMMLLKALCGNYYRSIGQAALARDDHEAAGKALSAAVAMSPNDPLNLLEFSVFLKSKGDAAAAMPLLARAVSLRPQDPLVLVELARAYSSSGRTEEARRAFLSVCALRPSGDNFFLNIEAGAWLNRNNFLQDAERVLLAAYEANQRDYLLLDELGDVTSRLGRSREAEAYRKQAAFLKKRKTQYPKETAANYNAIVSRVKAAGARMVVMQYPMRPLAPLRQIFTDPGGIVFVENKSNFTQALEQGEFNSYFADSFAGDFGHCTRAGNRLIAENLAQVLTEKVLSDILPR